MVHISFTLLSFPLNNCPTLSHKRGSMPTHQARNDAGKTSRTHNHDNTSFIEYHSGVFGRSTYLRSFIFCESLIVKPKIDVTNELRCHVVAGHAIMMLGNNSKHLKSYFIRKTTVK